MDSLGQEQTTLAQKDSLERIADSLEAILGLLQNQFSAISPPVVAKEAEQKH